MQYRLIEKRGVPIRQEMFGLFFEDINYSADGGLYAEMIENRSFEFYDCYGKKCDYYVKHDPGYGWSKINPATESTMEYVEGSPVSRKNPHYLRFTSRSGHQGFKNKAYSGIEMSAGKRYALSFYARKVSGASLLSAGIIKDGHTLLETYAEECGKGMLCAGGWKRYKAVLQPKEDISGGEFAIWVDCAAVVEFDFISLMPEDAVRGIFRKDILEALRELHPGFLRFPGGCIVEGNTLENRYRWKESVGPVEARKWNFSRWALHETKEEMGWQTEYSHYNQSLGLGYYEYFLLCEELGAEPLPVLNVGMACQYQSEEAVAVDSMEFREFIQDALDLIEFANGDADTRWGALRAGMGHPESFHLKMLGIGNEQWQTQETDFFARYLLFEKAIHGRYPDMKLIGSAGPDVISGHYAEAWKFFRKEAAERPDAVYAVDEHYYAKKNWFLEHTDFYDSYPRDVKVFAGEYAAHPDKIVKDPGSSTLEQALAEAAFLTGTERNADVVVLSSYAPLLARVGYAQWAPNLIWFDEKAVYLTPSYYVQKMYSENTGSSTLYLDGQEKELRENGIFLSASVDETVGEYILKVVNVKDTSDTLELANEKGKRIFCAARAQILGSAPDIDKAAQNPWDEKERREMEAVRCEEKDLGITGRLQLPAKSFGVFRIPAASARTV